MRLKMAESYDRRPTTNVYYNRSEKSKLEVLKTIEKVASKIAPGPAPSFNEAHVVKSLEVIANYGNVGRVSLSKELELGIGTTRTIIRHLKRERLIEGSKYGFVLSEQGKSLLSCLRAKMGKGIDVPNSSLTAGPSVVAVLVKDAAHKVGGGAEQRNTAIRAGARGATTLVFLGKRLIMPSKKDHSLRDLSPLHDIIISKLNPEENDVIIVGSGENKMDAENGATMASLKLLKSESIIRGEKR
jgi:predicted transcriptional regulator